VVVSVNYEQFVIWVKFLFDVFDPANFTKKFLDLRCCFVCVCFSYLTYVTSFQPPCQCLCSGNLFCVHYIECRCSENLT